MLTLNLSRIRTAHERFEQSYAPEVFTGTDAPSQDLYTIVQPVRLVVDVSKDQERFRLVGRVATRLELVCSRCLEPFDWPVDAAFDLQYQPKEKYAEHQEREIRDDDFAAAYYENETIDLGQLMAEQFHLSVPMKPLCTDDCRGLCPQCGTNLNRGTCDCRPDWDDPRLAALRALRRES
ncbi:MAG: DUF177 domain-containing protein [Vicinamibacterales bacterium]